MNQQLLGNIRLTQHELQAIQLGEQKIDVVLNILPINKKLPIYAIAKESGVKLV